MDDSLTIGTLARTTGVTRETIRWYEQIGLLQAPGRSSGNYRLYTTEHLARLSFIRRCRDMGFCLDEVRTLTDLAAHHEEDCADVTAIANARLIELDRRIASLMVLRQDLARVVGSCPGGRVAACHILAALSPKA